MDLEKQPNSPESRLVDLFHHWEKRFNRQGDIAGVSAIGQVLHPNSFKEYGLAFKPKQITSVVQAIADSTPNIRRVFEQWLEGRRELAYLEPSWMPRVRALVRKQLLRLAASKEI